MNNLLVVFNTCGIVRENINSYIDHIRSILNQEYDFKLVVSSCCNSELTKDIIMSSFNGIGYNSINEVLPISVTFNDTVNQSIKVLGEFKDYVFIDSGIIFNKPGQLRDLVNLHRSGDFAMTSARTNEDTGFNDWFKTSEYGDELFKDQHLIVPVGKAINLHVQIFTNELRLAYGNILPDIFAGQCMESTFSFLCAALKKKWVVHKDVILTHLTGMDGPSSGFSPAKWVSTGGRRWDHLFKTNESILDIIKRGYDFGMGYEENQSIVVHRDDQFINGLCINDNLKTYIRDNLYLNKNQYDYSIKAELVWN